MKNMTKRYYAPTPVVARKVGDTLMSVGTVITGSGLLGNHEWLGLVGLGITVLSKLTNLFIENN